MDTENSWGALRTTRDPEWDEEIERGIIQHDLLQQQKPVMDLDNLQSVADTYARALGIPPEKFPKIVVADQLKKPGQMALATNTESYAEVAPNGLPLVTKEVASPSGFIFLKNKKRENSDLSYLASLRHEMGHHVAYNNRGIPRESVSNPIDETHGPLGSRGGEAFYGGKIQLNPYYNDVMSDNPWSAVRGR